MKPKNCLFTLIILGALFLSTSTVFAHPGRTDSSGCHTCRTNCSSWGLSSGEYHCHKSKGLPQPKEPVKSHLNKNGTGYTEPAPEYKNPPTFSSPVSIPKSTSNISTTSASITYTLTKGMKNGQVTKLQRILARYPEIYPEGLITGYFGSATERAVERFQKKYGLEQVGYVGQKTRMLLNSL